MPLPPVPPSAPRLLPSVPPASQVPNFGIGVSSSTAEQLAVSHGVKILVYGNAATGKTLMIPTCPKPLVISVENGLLSLKKSNIQRVFGVNTPGISYEIPVAKITTVEGLTNVYEWVKNSNRGQYSTICLDSLSEIAEIILKNALANNKDGRMAYGDLAEQLVELCKAFRDLEGVNVYFSAKMGLCEDSNLFGPSFPGRVLNREIPYLFDELFQMQVLADNAGNPVRVLRTSADATHNAKDRSGALDPRGEFPNISHLISKISA